MDAWPGSRASGPSTRGKRDAGGRKVPEDVAGSEFEIGLDTLILAISQHAVLDFFGDRAPKLTPAGYIAVDPSTFESSVPGVYAGGDVADRGPASIVKAAADGKRVAAAIAASLGVAADGSPAVPTADGVRPDLQDLIVRRARREYRVPIQVSGLDRRDGFEETVLGYTAEEAVHEAGRCLDCDQVCSLCVGVCPEHGPDDVRDLAGACQPARAVRRERRRGGGRLDPPSTCHSDSRSRS